MARELEPTRTCGGLKDHTARRRGDLQGLVDSASPLPGLESGATLPSGSTAVALFVYQGTDGPRGLELRKTVRTKHLAYIQGFADAGRIRFAGPLYAADGEPCGSLVVFEADDLDAAREIAEADPYLVEGVFDGIEVRATKAVLP